MMMYYDDDALRQRRRMRREAPERPVTTPNSRRPRTSSSHAAPRPTSLRSQLWIASGVVSLLGVWFLTPLSDYLVHVVLLSVPLQADIDLGKESYKTFRRKYKQVRDNRYRVHEIGWELVESSVRLPKDHMVSMYDVFEYDWDFGIIQAGPTINAFALPGGLIRVTTALLEQLNLTDGELAALLGHEIGHVLHRHSQARIMKQKLLSTILNALIYSDDDDHQESFGEAVGELLLTSAQYLGELKFSRKNEYEADDMAWELLYASRKYNPRALESLLTKLWSLEGRSTSSTAGDELWWSNTHPGTKDRITMLQNKWKELPMYQQHRLNNYPVK